MQELTLAQKLQRLRGTELQNVVAARANVPPSTLSLLERGQRGGSEKPGALAKRMGTLIKLAAVYGVPLEYLTANQNTYMRSFALNNLGPRSLSPAERLDLVMDELEKRYGVLPMDLADTLGVSTPDLLAYRAGRLRIKRSVFRRLEETAGIPVEWITHGPDREPPDPDSYDRAISLAKSNGLTPQTLEQLLMDWTAQKKKRTPYQR